jgi:malonate-semialdehyde dehydrogenase (acetylating) / methylmalonate-semialdehyde dehydrogenase
METSRIEGIRAMKHVSHWIGGKPWAGEAASRGDIYNPATG